jgi:Glycosyl transferase family 64 domain
LHQSLESLAFCDAVGLVQIEWTASADTFPESLLQLHNAANGTNVVNAAKASVNGIIKKTGIKLSSDAILLLDERIRLSCSDIGAALEEWKLDPTRIVGFAIGSSGSSFSSNMNSYGLVSDHAAIVHRHYYSNFKSRRRSFVRQQKQEYVDKNDNCQHLSLSAYILATSKQNPAIMSTEQSTLDLASTQHEASFLYFPMFDDIDCLELLSQYTGVSVGYRTTVTRFLGRRFLPEK